MSLISAIKKICMPSKIYLGMSIITILFALFNNVSLLYLLKICLITVFWTWNLQIICKSGYTNISWVLILLPALYTFLFQNEYFTHKYSGVITTSGANNFGKLLQKIGSSGGGAYSITKPNQTESFFVPPV